MKEETIALRVEPKLKREVELVAKVLHVSSSEWLRTRIAQEVKHLVEDLKSQIVFEYMKGNLTKKELKELFGKSAEDIDFIIEKTRKDLLKAKKFTN
jgi:archaellum component FlaC